jgi:MEDS: MEthanogen/methylotroph, DcmR Sensory domain
MNTTGATLLANPQPCGHIVYPYHSESQFADAVCLFAGAGLRKGESALLVMEESHCEPIRKQLHADGLDVEELEASGRLICKNAEALLESFMFDELIDEDVFKTKIGWLIEQAKTASSSGQVRVFGEMVNLLWMPNPKATRRLEELWNEVIKLHSVPLLCAYSLGGLRPDALPVSLLACHSAAV